MSRALAHWRRVIALPDAARRPHKLRMRWPRDDAPQLRERERPVAEEPPRRPEQWTPTSRTARTRRPSPSSIPRRARAATPRLRKVRKLGDPVLRATALPVERFDDELQAEVERMGELMHDALGVGLAATQLGVLHRVLVYRADPEDPMTALVNPVLEWTSDELEIAEEGCLSLPGVHVEVERPAQVRVRARDAGGQELEVRPKGWPRG